ncbi:MULTISPECIES: hypothetical protein [unclassified Fibrobacter]|uniref:hypothetical protein n=1 Tax=unclassified Fibrobacter TaxID=2634177 RepID=UPI000D6C92E6|nr:MULTISPECIES: hypothetical protein [unclassified Fibrobacter]PWJ70143.1 hypothetical protein BGX12_103108 [Fibrobacter sp. UWR4]PZW73492.1 hypothetical protein C8E88_1003110 [Fibrobacter sp. UWR1]
MSKKDVEPKAKEPYVIHQLTLAEISRELKVSTRTLQNWKAAGEWDLERTRLGTSESYCHHSLFDIVEIKTRRIKQDELNGVPVSSQRVADLERFISAAEKCREYESKAPKKEKSETSPEERQKIAIKKAKEMFGLCPKS